MDHQERIEVKLEHVEALEQCVVAAHQMKKSYEQRLKRAEWELHNLMALPDTITDVFDEPDDD
jgi:hypothetical protein